MSESLLKSDSFDFDNADVLATLNMARRMELTAIHQYMCEHYDLDDMDYQHLAKKVKELAIKEMKHAEMFAERIKELDGTPTSDIDVPVKKNLSVEEIFEYNTFLEEDTLKKYNLFVSICAKHNDHVSKKLFTQILQEEQEHFNDFDDIRSHIKELGNTYLAAVAINR